MREPEVSLGDANLEWAVAALGRAEDVSAPPGSSEVNGVAGV